MTQILVVDDDPLIRHLTRLWLEEAGYSVVDAEHGRIALDLFERQDFNLVVTDIFMPEFEGLGLLRELRRQAPHVPVLTMSGGSASDMDYLKAAKRLGAVEALEKPLHRHQFLETVARCLKASEPPLA